MSYWLTGLLPKVSTRDMILMRLKAILAREDTVRAVVKDHVYRRQAYVPFTSTLATLPALILAPWGLDEKVRLSGVIKSSFSVGIMLEFQDFGDSIPDGEPSADSFVEAVQGILDANQLLLLDGEAGEDNPCSIAKHSYQSIQPDGKEVAGNNATTYYAGLVVTYDFRQSFPRRLTGVAGQI